MNDIKELESYLKKLDEAYYNNDESLISDIEYDAIKKRYLELTGKEEYDYVPGDAMFNKVEHSTPILSLDKKQIVDKEEVISEIKRLWPIIIQPKMDGLTIVYYNDTKKYVTRGNGRIGENVTESMNGVSGLGEDFGQDIRGEAVMLISEFNKINEERKKEGLEPFKNPRNAAAGMLRNLDTTKVKGLKMYAYNTINEEESNDSLNQIEELKKNGWNTVPTFVPQTIEEAMEYIESFDKSTLDYEIDGLVVKHNGDKKFGFTGHHPKGAFAIKFKQEGVWTKLIDVKWNTGKTGIVAPVAILEPIELLGATVSRATLHNIAFINNLDLEIGKDVKVIKANEIIPRIIDSKGKGYLQIGAPNVCPSCNNETEFEEDILYCTNPNCIAQLTNKIINLASRDALDISGLSEATVEKMINYAKENNIELSLTLPFKFSLEDILALPGFARKSAEKLYKAINKAKDTELKRFIYAANIPLIGRSASEDIANKLLTADALAEDLSKNCLIISTIRGIGDKMIEKLNIYGLEIFGELYAAGIVPREVKVKQQVKANDEILTFVITGAFEIGRKEIEKIIKDSGHKVSGSVSSKTSYLIAAPGEEGTSKYKKAISLGTKIINSLDELKEII